MTASQQYFTFLNQQVEALCTSPVTDTSNEKKPKKSRNLSYAVSSFIDLFLLIVKLSFSKAKKSYEIIYTAKSFCIELNGELEDRIAGNIAIKNRIYINQGKNDFIKAIDGNKVYNVGFTVKFVALLVKKKNKSFTYLYAYSIINNCILFFFKGKNIYSLCYYDLNGLSLAFSKYRKKINLIEVQHGSMINYYPYLIPSEIKIADVFYVKNQQTITYLKQHLNKNFQDIQYELLPYSKSNAVYKEGKHILYASTVEFNGIHPVFLDYLKQIKSTENTTIYLRLHPREKNKTAFFKNQITDVKAHIIIDDSKNWLESNLVKNLVVVSPWSSVIEDAADNQYRSIIIDEMGKDRFAHLIDNRNVIYANNLLTLLEAINHDL